MTTPLLFLDVGGGEILLIFVVVLVFFGPGKIPELARGLGKGIREFKDASSEIRSEFERATTPPVVPVAYTAHEPAPEMLQQTAQDPAALADHAPGLPIAEDSAPGAPDTVALPVAEPAVEAETAPPPVVVVGGVPGTRARGTQLPAPTGAEVVS